MAAIGAQTCFALWALGWDVPVFAHLPLILSPTGGKLSKAQRKKAGIAGQCP